LSDFCAALTFRLAAAHAAREPVSRGRSVIDSRRGLFSNIEAQPGGRSVVAELQEPADGDTQQAPVQLVTYDRDRGGSGFQLYRYREDAWLVDHYDHGRRVSWSPDGKRLAFVEGPYAERCGHKILILEPGLAPLFLCRNEERAARERRLSPFVQLGCLVRADSGSGVPDEAAVSRATVGLGASFCDHCARDSLSRPGIPLAREPTTAQRATSSRLPRPDRELLGDATQLERTRVRS
jgi:hypothetical protein